MYSHKLFTKLDIQRSSGLTVIKTWPAKPNKRRHLQTNTSVWLPWMKNGGNIFDKFRSHPEVSIPSFLKSLAMQGSVTENMSPLAFRVKAQPHIAMQLKSFVVGIAIFAYRGRSGGEIPVIIPAEVFGLMLSTIKDRQSKLETFPQGACCCACADVCWWCS